MTGFGPNFLTGGTASASSSYGGHPASSAVDGNTVTAWESGLADYIHIWSYDLGEGVTKIAKRLSINSGTYFPNEGPRAFVLQASNTGAFVGEETALLVSPDEGAWNPCNNKEWTFENEIAYRYYRLYMTHSPLALWTTLAEVMLFEELEGDYSNDLISGGTPTASDTEGSYYPTRAVDEDLETFWRSQNTSSTHWFQYDFGEGSEKIANMLLLQAGTDYTFAGYEPSVFTLQASNTGAFAGEETTFLTETTHRTCANERKFWGFTNTTAYRYYRINTTASGMGTNEVYLADMNLLALELEPEPEPTPLTAVVNKYTLLLQNLLPKGKMWNRV